MEVVLLGTSGGLPTVNRNLPSVALRYSGQLILFDCGEGTQRQMIMAKTGFSSKMKIFVTHLHGDHVLGIPGLIQTMSLLNRKDKLDIYGPPGILNYINSLKDYVKFNLTFPIEVQEVDEGVVYKDKNYKILAAWAEHTVPNLAYAFVEANKPGKFYPNKALELKVPMGPLWHRLQHGHSVKLRNGSIVKPTQVVGPPRPGLKIVYVGDTRPSKAVIKLAKNADLLIHDCTFGDEYMDKAETDGHSTPSQVAKIAKVAGVKKLVLTHISARYDDTDTLLKQAKKIFQNVEVGRDLLKIRI
jgi:ribonuclease Z